MIEYLQPDGLVRSPAFSHAAVVPPGATMVYVGGQNGVDQTGRPVSDDVAEQSVRAVRNIATGRCDRGQRRRRRLSAA